MRDSMKAISILSLAFLVLLNGCAAKVAPHNPDDGDLISYGKQLIENNRYHINQRVEFLEGSFDGLQSLTVMTTSRMGGNVFFKSMLEACEIQGGRSELNDTEDSLSPRARDGLKANLYFTCRTLVQVTHIRPYQLGRQYNVFILSSPDEERDLTGHLHRI
jgi:hypothetical protein